MTQEQEERSSALRSVTVDFERRVIETLAQDGTVVRFTYRPEGVLQTILLAGGLEAAAARLVTADQRESPVEELPTVPEAQPTPGQPAPEGAPRREKSPALVLPGRLKNQPTDGRPDGHRKPTAVAHFLAHLPEGDGATLLFATFHNHTREIALALAAGDPITAQGYYHPSRDPSRLPTFSVFHLINYPGKPQKS